MTFSEAEIEVLNRFHEKCRIAGGAKPGYNLRRRAIQGSLAAGTAAAIDEGLTSLVEKGLLAGNEAGDRFILTAAGVEALSAEPT